jgi:hypothetical protein
MEGKPISCDETVPYFDVSADRTRLFMVVLEQNQAKLTVRDLPACRNRVDLKAPANVNMWLSIESSHMWTRVVSISRDPHRSRARPARPLTRFIDRKAVAYFDWSRNSRRLASFVRRPATTSCC